jgi:hypothetical protein
MLTWLWKKKTRIGRLGYTHIEDGLRCLRKLVVYFLIIPIDSILPKSINIIGVEFASRYSFWKTIRKIIQMR